MASRPKQAEPRPAPRLYLVTPRLTDTAAFAGDLTGALAAADVAAVLLRLADADERTLINHIKTLVPLAQDHGTALLLEGHAELVARSGADGAHLSGSEAFTDALEHLKPERIVGVGNLSDRHDAMLAAETGADYVMFGEPLECERDLIAITERVGWWAEVFELPCVGFAANLDEVGPQVAAGADFVALDCLWSDPRGIAAAVADATARARLPETTPWVP
jgi:thiamine-phosphate pyrophosphorylase